MEGGEARCHAREERERVNREREQQPAEEADSDNAESYTDNKHGGNLLDKGSNGCAFHHHHHGGACSKTILGGPEPSRARARQLLKVPNEFMGTEGGAQALRGLGKGSAKPRSQISLGVGASSFLSTFTKNVDLTTTKPETTTALIEFLEKIVAGSGCRTPVFHRLSQQFEKLTTRCCKQYDA